MPNPTPIPFVDLAAELAGQRPAIDAAIRRVLDSGQFLLGRELIAFEAELAEFCGTGEAVGVASGLAALTLMLQAFDIGPDDEVIVPSNTYIATWLAVSRVGASPVPVEPEIATRNLDPAKLSAALSPRTRAVLAVHLYGTPCDMTALDTFCKTHNLPLLIDAAQACGAAWQGKRRACLGDAAAFSFYPTKNLGALGDAGAVVTDDAARAERIRLLRNYGMRDRYQHDHKGENARMEELHAAVLRVRLNDLAAGNARRAKLANSYLSRLSKIPGIGLPASPVQATPAWHLFTVLLPDRKRVVAALDQVGIGSAIHYPIPPHLSGAYRSEFTGAELPVAEALADSILSLPLYPCLHEEALHRVVDALERILPGAGGS